MPFSTFRAPAPSGPHSNVQHQSPGLPSPARLPNPTPLNTPPSGPPAPPGSGNANTSPTGGNQYNPGRGYRRPQQRQQGSGFWNGRPEFTGAAFNYNRMQIRPLTVARRNSTTRFDLALASTAGALWNGRKGRGETEGNFQQTDGPVGGGTGGGVRTSGQAAHDAWMEPSGPSMQEESDAWDAAHPNVTSIGMDLTKGDTQMPTVGTVAKTVGKTIFTSEGRGRAKAAYNEVRGGGVPAGSADPWESGRQEALDIHRQRQEAAQAAGGKKPPVMMDYGGEGGRTSGFVDPYTGEAMDPNWKPREAGAPF